MNIDASCSLPCDGEAMGKPDMSEWVWTKYGGDAGGVEVVENPTGGTDGLPNVGCMWKCNAGYALQLVDSGQGTAVASNYTDTQPMYFCAQIV